MMDVDTKTPFYESLNIVMLQCYNSGVRGVRHVNALLCEVFICKCVLVSFHGNS